MFWGNSSRQSAATVFIQTKSIAVNIFCIPIIWFVCLFGVFEPFDQSIFRSLGDIDHHCHRHLRGSVTIKPIAECLTVKLSLPVLSICLSRFGFEHRTFRLPCEPLSHRRSFACEIWAIYSTFFSLRNFVPCKDIHLQHNWEKSTPWRSWIYFQTWAL